MKLAIMQPYFFPYIGYFQLIAAVDKFIIYDNVKYTKKGWINRNRLLHRGQDVVFSLPLKGGSDYLNICQREISSDFNPAKLLNLVREAYRKAPYFEEVYPALEKIINFKENNLFLYLLNSVSGICDYLEIKTEIVVSSTIQIDHNLKAQEKVIDFLKKTKAETYLNPIGGVELYSKDEFRKNNIELKFIKSRYITYKQFELDFIPWLSIIDVLMFNSLKTIQDQMISNFEEL